MSSSDSTAPVDVRALTFKYPGADYKFTEYQIQRPIGKTEVLVKIQYAALNPVDYKLADTSLGYFMPGEKGLGKDFMGTIEEVGSDVTNFACGDKVCGKYTRAFGRGTLATYAAIDTAVDAIMKVPETLSDEENAAWPLALCTAYEALIRAKLDETSNVCILGGSTAVGLFAIQLAKNVFNVQNVTVTCSAASAELVKSYGADEVVDYRTEDHGEALVKMVGGQPKKDAKVAEHPSLDKKFSIIFDNIDDADVWARVDQLLAPQSTGSAYVTINLNSAKSMACTLYSKFFGIKKNFFLLQSDNGPGFKMAPEWFKSGAVRIPIDDVKSWKDHDAAFGKLKSQRAHGKIVLKID